MDVQGGVRLLGVGISALAEAVQQDLFDPSLATPATAPEHQHEEEDRHPAHHWYPGNDVVHDEHGRGWVERVEDDAVTIRFETPDTPPGPARRLPRDDAGLRPAPPPN